MPLIWRRSACSACSMATARSTPAAPRRRPAFPSRLSTMSICSIEDVAAAADKPFWFQLYVMSDRGFIKELIERAIAANCSALVLTVDLQVLGQRHRDIKNGMTVPPEWSLSNLIDFATKPAWVVRRAPRQAPHLRQSRRPRQRHGRRDSLSEWTASQFDPSLSWNDIDWIRSIWPGKLILKGILDVEDAEDCRQGRRASAGGLQPRRPSARRRAVLDRGVAGDRRCGRLEDRDHVRRRHPLRPGRDARAGARRQVLHDRPRLCLRPRRRRPGRRRERDRHPRATNSTSPWACAASTPSPRSTTTCWRFDLEAAAPSPLVGEGGAEAAPDEG